MSKLWGGRFSKETDAMAHAFNASIQFDQRLFAEDIEASVAWAGALEKGGILEPGEAQGIVNGLQSVLEEFEIGTFQLLPGDEDIHSAVERRLIELVGPLGGKLHTGRSRNDQVATDFRLWVMRACEQLDVEVRALQQSLLTTAEGNLSTPMPGYTHLQPAQPVAWGHWALSHFWPLDRDRRRLATVRRESAVLPLGSAALAGTAFPIDREALAQTLGFESISANSIDATSDRDFAASFLFASAMIGLHLSRFCEQMIIFNSRAFGFVQLDDAFSTGSSIMPQKKNPDMLELARGKSGRLIGNLTGLLATLKGLPSAYDKDMQEDKEPVFDSFDTLSTMLPVIAGLVGTLEVRPDVMAAHLDAGLLATELADYLAKKGVPFRTAHEIVGRAVRLSDQQNVSLSELSLEDLKQISDAFEDDVMAGMSVEAALEARNVPGGTARSALIAQLAQAREAVEGD